MIGGERRDKARALANGEDPDGDAATLDVLAALQKFAGVRPDPEAFLEALEPLQPRLYSISSSPQGDARPGVADRRRGALSRSASASASASPRPSSAERVAPGDSVKVYVQKAHGFAPAGRSRRRRSS